MDVIVGHLDCIEHLLDCIEQHIEHMCITIMEKLSGDVWVLFKISLSFQLLK